MKQLFTAIVAAAVAFTAAATDIYGYQGWEFSETPTRGPIRFPAEDPRAATMIADQTEEPVIYAGYYLDYHWYVQVIKKGTQSSVDGLYELDMTTGERTLLVRGGTKLIDMTYDYSDGKVYGIRTGNQYLATLNPATGAIELIGQFKYEGTPTYMLAIAATLDGTLYGVSPDDNFYRISKADASLTLVGALGQDAGYDQTMCFDYNTGTLYWANNANYWLSTINVETGEATPVSPIGIRGISSMGAMFVPYINVAVGAPDRVTGVSAIPAADAVTLTWTNPAITAQGETLAALDKVIIERDGVAVAEVTDIAVGAASSFVDAGLESGKDYSYKLVPVNSAGRGGVDSRAISVRVGNDLPGAVGNLTATQGDGSAILTWTAPEAGRNGGLFSPADVKGYKVKRGNTVIATLGADVLTYTDVRPFGKYNYTVAAFTDEGDGVESTIENFTVKPEAWIVMTNGTATLQTGKDYEFYDEGGPAGVYVNSCNYTLTLAPAEPDAYVVAEFTEFELDTYGDWLRVYDGLGTGSTFLGEFASESVPSGLQHIEAASADGTLTFVFQSDIMDARAGWKANVEVVKRLEHDLEISSPVIAAFTAAGEPAEYKATITNKGTAVASGYTVVLMNGNTELASVAGPELEPAASAVVVVPYTPLTPGMLELNLKVKYAADQDESNNTTASASQSVLEAGSSVITVVSPDPAGVSVLPYSFMGIESLSQLLVTADRLPGVAGKKLVAIEFPFQSVTKTYTGVPVQMWAGNTTETDLSAGSLPVDGQTLVFEGNIDVAPGIEALSLAFPEGVVYDGGTLVLTFHKCQSNTADYGVSYRGDYGYGHTHDNICRFASRSYPEDEPLNPNGNIGYSANNHLPDMTLIFSGNSGVDKITIGSGTVAATADGIFSALDAEVFAIDGRMVAAITAGTTAHLPAGIYIVRTPRGSVKVSVR